MNKRRWEIEECFRITKTDFDARPVYVKRQDRIVAHFMTCFIALIVCRYLEQKLGGKYIIDQIPSTLREIDFVKYEEKGYQPFYTGQNWQMPCTKLLGSALPCRSSLSVR